MMETYARYVQKVEATVTEEIVCRVLPYFLTLVEFDLPDIAASTHPSLADKLEPFLRRILTQSLSPGPESLPLPDTC